MNAQTRMILTEARLFARELPSLFFTIGFPTVLILALGAFYPGFRDAAPELGGRRLIDLYVPIVLALALASAALGVLPNVIATYRQLGVLRRLATTPVGPVRLLVAQLAVQVVAALIGAIAAVTAATLAFGTPVPENVPALVLAFVLAAAAVFALGLVVAAVARTSGQGSSLGMLLYFPALFFSGIYFPREAMPPLLRTVSDFTPLGAGVQAMQDAWAGNLPAAGTLLVMAAFGLVGGAIAARLFRWE